MSASDLFFAYGTLRRDAAGAPPEIAEALARAEHLGRAHARRCRLRRMGAYPAMVRSDAEPDRVLGDVYRIDQALWPQLDSYEGDAYVREMVSVILEGGAQLQASAYLARDARLLGAAIPGGDFLA
jgi:gamma-glutamylcyclotransferase (GGCT)/AIG2-like uncharacterized protein YtfP